MKGSAGGFQGGGFQKSHENASVTKKRHEKASRKCGLTLDHDGLGKQARGSYGAVATVNGTKENAPSCPRGWLCLLGGACAWTWGPWE